MPAWINYHFVEAVANLALFIPFGFLVATSRPGTAWSRLVVIGLVTSSCIEVGQLFFVTARVPSVLDIVTNTVGTAVGVALAKWVTLRNRRAGRNEPPAC